MSFDGSTNLGAEQHLPDDLFEGLTSLASLSLNDCGVQKLPNMDNLTALKSLSAWGNHMRMNSIERETQFDGLVAAQIVNLESNLLTRVPSVKNMQTCRSMWLAANQITAIFPGDFFGAVRLVVLTLGGNRITKVAPEAFVNLAAFRVKPNEFKPTNADGTPYQDAYGIGVWPHTGLGFFGGHQEWANVPISFSPNPVQCLWVGPRASDFDCSRCGLGYEAISADNATCVKPEFRPHREWWASEERVQLQLQDTRGVAVKGDTGAGMLTLLTDQAYTIPAPKLLKQKAKMFVGYKQPYSKITYELDFSLGAEVDVGCGTSVVGNGAVDENIPKDASGLAHPHSMLEYSFQWVHGRANLKAEPPDYGYYPQKCSRFHRFRVTHPGNFTFVRAVIWHTLVLRHWSLSLFLSHSLLLPPPPRSLPANPPL